MRNSVPVQESAERAFAMGVCRERFLGCLLGGAVGDALGSPFEGLWSRQVPSAERLLADFAEYEGFPLGQWTDDTQLTLATLESIVEEGEIYPLAIARALARLWSSGAIVAPKGASTRAALSFLRHGDWTACGTPEGHPDNSATMRTLPLGLYFWVDPEILPDAVATVTSITHSDARSQAGSIGIAKAAQVLARCPSVSGNDLAEIVAGVMEAHEASFADLVRQLPDLLHERPETAHRVISAAGMFHRQIQDPIITPFVIPTVLATLWIVLRHDKWENAVTEAIRLGGDVGTLAALVGSLMGIKLGAHSVPRHLADRVVDRERLLAVTDRFHQLVANRKPPRPMPLPPRG